MNIDDLIQRMQQANQAERTRHASHMEGLQNALMERDYGKFQQLSQRILGEATGSGSSNPPFDSAGEGSELDGDEESDSGGQGRNESIAE